MPQQRRALPAAIAQPVVTPNAIRDACGRSVKQSALLAPASPPSPAAPAVPPFVPEPLVPVEPPTWLPETLVSLPQAALANRQATPMRIAVLESMALAYFGWRAQQDAEPRLLVWVSQIKGEAMSTVATSQSAFPFGQGVFSPVARIIGSHCGVGPSLGRHTPVPSANFSQVSVSLLQQ